MQIFNLRFICKAPVPNVRKYNTYTLGDAADVGVGIIEGIEFFVTLDDKTFHLVQCVDEHVIDFVPEEAKSQDDYTNIFCHNTYEDKYDVMCDYVTAEQAMLLEALWLYSIDNSDKYSCLAVV